MIVGGNIRLHLWFTSRTYPAELADQRANVAHWVRAADIVFTVIMLATGLAIAGDHRVGARCLFPSASAPPWPFLIIEPTTARAGRSNGIAHEQRLGEQMRLSVMRLPGR